MKAPAFQFYPMDFMQGAKYLTLAERGAYISLLCEQWDQGSVSGDIGELAIIFGCGKKETERVWRKVAGKFDQGADGRYRNARLEREREKQERFRSAQSDRGKLGGRPKKAVALPDESGGLAGEKPSQSPRGPSPSSSSLSSSSDLKVVPDPPTRSTVGGGLIVSPLQWAKQAEKFTFYGSRLRVPHVLHSELMAKLGGAEPHDRLCAWYVEVNTDAEVEGTPIPDVFKFLRPKFESWASASAADSELEKFRPKGA